VVFDGAAQSITNPTGEIFRNITFNGSGTKTLSSNIVVNGNLTIGTGVTLAAGSNFIDLYGNWASTGSAFTFGTSTVRLLGSSVQQIGRANLVGETFYNLVVNNLGGVSPQIDVTSDIAIAANGTLTLTSGIIESTSADLITFNNNTNVVGGANNSHINGPVAKTGTSDFVFPTGKSGRWARIGVRSLSSSSTFRAEYFPSGYPQRDRAADLFNISGYEHWILDRTTGTGSAYVRLYWEDTTFSKVLQPNTIVVARFDGTRWNNQGGVRTVLGISGTVESISPMTSFSPQTLGTEDQQNPLPLQLIQFNAKKENGKVTLEWVTASENNTSHFDVQRSSDGLAYEASSRVKAAGNSTVRIKYNADDLNPIADLAFYRLKMVDLNGDYTYSPIITVSEYGKLNFELQPNPTTSDAIYLELNNLKVDEQVLVSLEDLQGKQFLQSIFKANAESQQLHLKPNTKLTSGVYLISVINNRTVIRKRIVVK